MKAKKYIAIALSLVMMWTSVSAMAEETANNESVKEAVSGGIEAIGQTLEAGVQSLVESMDGSSRESTGEDNGITITTQTTQISLAEIEAKGGRVEETSNQIQPLSTSAEDEFQKAMLQNYGADQLSPFRNRVSGENISGNTNQLRIEETDLHLDGKNGLDVDIVRTYANQYTKRSWKLEDTGERYTIVDYYVCSFDKYDEEDGSYESVDIGFRTEDEFYVYMEEGCYLSGWQAKWQVKGETFYDFSSMMEYMGNEEDRIELVPSGKVNELVHVRVDDPGKTIDDTIYFEPKNNLGNQWFLSFPRNDFVVTYEETESFPSKTPDPNDPDDTTKIEYDVYRTREFKGSFRDIHNNIRNYGGYQTINEEDGIVSINTGIYSFDNVKYYYFAQDQEEDGVQYNFKAVDSDGLTYYMYSPDWWKSKKVRADIRMIQDHYGNAIRYEHDSNHDVTKVIDTYGREILISNTGISYYDPAAQETRSITYTQSELPSSALPNESKWDFRDVQRFSVTNQNGETTHYDSRKIDGLVSVYAGNAPDLEHGEITRLYGYCEQFDCIERILYPTGYESRYVYNNIYMTDRTMGVKRGVPAVIQREDVVDGGMINQKQYILEKTRSLGDIEITQRRTADQQKNVRVFDDVGRMVSDHTYQELSYQDRLVNGVDYKYENDDDFNPKTVKTTSNGVVTEETRVYAGNNLLRSQAVNNYQVEYNYHQWETVDDDGDIEYQTTNIPQTTIYSEKVGNQYVEDYRIETTLADGHLKMGTQTVIQDDTVKAKTAYSYDDSGELSQVKIWTRDTNGDGVLDEQDSYTVTDSQTQLNARGLLQVVNTAGDLTDADGEQIPNITQQYLYNIYGSPTQQTDGNGNITAIAYDALNRPIQYTLPNGGVQTIEYNLPQLYTIVTDEKGVKTKYLYDEMGRNIRQQTEYNGEWKDVAQVTYDNLGRAATQTAYITPTQGTKTVNTYDNFDRVVQAEVYNLSGTKLYTENYTYSNGSAKLTVTKTTTPTDSSPVTTQKTVTDNMGNVIEQEISDGTNTYTTTAAYDYQNRPITETDARGFTTTYTYDYAGNVITVDGKDSLASSAYDLAGRKISDTDKKGNTIRYEYDGLGRVIRQISPFDEENDAVTKTYYDANSNVVKQMVQNNQPGEAERFRTTEYKYDSMNNVIASIGENGDTDQVVQYQYDSRNLLTKMITGLTAYTENPAGGAQTQYTYDAYGRLETTIDPMGMETGYSYDYLGNQTGAADRNGNQTAMQYGVFGMTKMTVTGDGRSESTENSYNSLGQVTVKKLYENNALTDQVQYTYDAFGRVTKEEENGRTKEYAYDENSNVTNFQLKQGDQVKQNISYTYNDYDWLENLSTGNISFLYTYDDNGNLIRKAKSGGHISYTYNYANLPVTMENYGAKEDYNQYSYTYALDGNRLTDTETNGVSKAYTYDGLGRLTNETQTNGNTTDSYTYVYDAYGNRQSMTVTGSESYTTNYSYDLNNRLLSATKNLADKQEVTNYRYDNNGNELFRHTVTYTEDGSYDINVNTGSNGFTVSEYNLMGQVTRVNTDKAEVSYSYNVNGLRKSKTVNSETTNFIWNGQNMVAEANGDDIIQNTYTYDITGVILRNDSDWYLKNAHGDVVGMADSNNNLIQEYRYDAFGNQIGRDEADNNPFRYSGEYWDGETENIYLRARMYDPGTGRFTSEDPAKDGLNWYSYCESEPVNRMDATGYEWGYIRDFINSLTMIYGDKYTITPTNNNSIIVTMGDGLFAARGEFYYDGRAKMPRYGGRQYVVEQIGSNINDLLYMNREDFYRAMGLNTEVFIYDLEVTEEKNFAISATSSLIISALSFNVESKAGKTIAALAGATIGASVPLREVGKYKLYATVGEAYSGVTGTYVATMTLEYWMVEDQYGNGVSKDGPDFCYTYYYDNYTESFLKE